MDRNLDAFLAVAKTENLTIAANQLGVTQPSITKRIANLEAQLETALFERHRRGMTLTIAGRFFYKRAKRIAKEYKQGQEELAALASTGLTTLQICAGPVFCLRYIAELFKTLKFQYPNLQFELSTDVSNPKVQALNDSEIDVYMGIIEPKDLDDSILVKYVTYVEHGVVMRADDPHASLEKINPAWFSHYNWVMFSDDPESESSILSCWDPGPATISSIDVHTSSFAAGLQLVRQGEFVMAAPLQLAPIIEKEGLVVRPTRQGMPKKQAGIYLRKSTLEFGVIRSLLDFFDNTDL